MKSWRDANKSILGSEFPQAVMGTPVVWKEFIMSSTVGVVPTNCLITAKAPVTWGAAIDVPLLLL